MVKILMHGCNGHMGQVITRLVEAEADMEIIAGVDVSDHISNAYPVYKSLEDYRQACGQDGSLLADVAIDFSSAAAVDKLLDYCEAQLMPSVLCTTGLSPEQLERELGTQLFERIGRRIRLTEDGARFIPYAQELLKAARNARTFVQGARTPSGRLRIGTAEEAPRSSSPEKAPKPTPA